MRFNLHSGILAAVCTFALSFFTSTARAEVAEVIISAKFEPVKAAGLLISSTGAIHKKDASYEKLENGWYSVTFPYGGSEVGHDTMVTAEVSSAAGDVAFGNLRSIHAPDSKRIALDLPECPHEPPAQTPNIEQLGLLLKLVEVRSARRELVQIKVNRMLEGPFLEKLRKLEQGFGLAEGERPLDVDLPSVELVNRLSKISIAIKNYELHKEKEIR
jgi:hypothetical protein